ncbi:MAG: DNA gyrase subunit A, partial [Chloroflexi bacterium]|nr:DNA gyrase subunit A [Chloroflexota bacterium]
LPNLLVNGASGIAVGMATNIPPHNLGEVCDALIYLIDHYDQMEGITAEQLMKFVKGPDFPTAGIVYRYREAANDPRQDTILNTYATGKGRFTVQAKTHVEPMSRNRNRVVITELPYQVNKTRLIERIATLARDGKLEGVVDLRDESDRQGMRVVIELTRTVEPADVLSNLYRLTPMRTTFGAILLVLVDGQPRLTPLKRALHLFLEHRQEIITRRSQFELDRARQRAHILEGLRIALEFLDEVIRIIRQSRTADTARNNLRKKLKLTKVQAQAILDLQLRRLAALERRKIEQEYKETLKKIRFLEDLLAHPEKVLQAIKAELQELKKQYNNPRRTQIVEIPSSGVLTTAELVPDVQILLTVTRDGEVRRNRVGTRRQKVRRANTLARASTRDELLFLTETGTGYRLAAHQIPDGEAVQLSTLVSVPAGQPVTTVLSVPEDKNQLVLVTARGVVKRVATEVLSAVLGSGTPVMRVADGDRLIWAGFSTGDQDVILVSATGQAIRFAETDVRSMGLTAAGVAGIRLAKGDTVVSADLIASQSQEMLVASSAGYGKRVRLSDFPRQGRGGKGVVAMKLTKTTGLLAAAVVVSKKERVVLISEKGFIADVAVQHVSLAGRSARGAIIAGLRAKDTVRRLVNLG